jgi:hypothetical protein
MGCASTKPAEVDETSPRGTIDSRRPSLISCKVHEQEKEEAANNPLTGTTGVSDDDWDATRLKCHPSNSTIAKNASPANLGSTSIRSPMRVDDDVEVTSVDAPRAARPITAPYRAETARPRSVAAATARPTPPPAPSAPPELCNRVNGWLAELEAPPPCTPQSLAYARRLAWGRDRSEHVAAEDLASS